MQTNRSRISKGFQTLLPALAPFLTQELYTAYGERWWSEAVLDRLQENQKQGLPAIGNKETLTKSLGIGRCLLLLGLHWEKTFHKALSIDSLAVVKELLSLRNRMAKNEDEDFSEEETVKALENMARLCDQLSVRQSDKIRALITEAQGMSAAPRRRSSTPEFRSGGGNAHGSKTHGWMLLAKKIIHRVVMLAIGIGILFAAYHYLLPKMGAMTNKARTVQEESSNGESRWDNEVQCWQAEDGRKSYGRVQPGPEYRPCD